MIKNFFKRFRKKEKPEENVLKEKNAKRLIKSKPRKEKDLIKWK